MTQPFEALQKGDGLLIVDVQNDFCPGGALPITDGNAIVPVLNRWTEAACRLGVPIYASCDWHPLHHISFREAGGKWPTHCLQDSEGAAFHPELRLPENFIKIAKGVRFDKDQNSAFDDTGLAQRLKSDGIQRLWVGGLAEEVCVLATVLDARKAGLEVRVIATATRPITPAGGREAIAAMLKAGALIIEG